MNESTTSTPDVADMITSGTFDDAFDNAVPMSTVAPDEEDQGSNGAAAVPAVHEPVEPLATRTLDDGPPEPTRWLIGGILPEEACVVLGAEEKTGKTWLAFDMAICLATGEKLLDLWEPQETGPTLVYSLESGWNARKQRLWGLCWGRGLDPRVALQHIHFLTERLNLADPRSVRRLGTTVEAIKPRLLIIDPLVTAWQDGDENASGDLQRILNPVRDICLAHQPMAVVVAHHLNKAHRDRSAFAGLRGSSALGAWSDGLMSLRRESDEVGAVRRLDVVHRDASSPTPIGWTLRTSAGEVDGTTSFKLEPCDAPINAPKASPKGAPKASRLDNALVADVLRLVANANGTLTRGQGADRLECDRAKFNRYFKRLHELEKVGLTPDGKMVIA